MGNSVVGKTKWLVLAISLPILLMADQWTKQLILNQFQWGESLSVIEGFFSITYVRNPGAAFGFMAQAPDIIRIPFFILVPLCAFAFLGWMFWTLPKTSLGRSGAVSFIIAGALGNVIDRARFGYVIDFLDFHWNEQWHYPAFNIADSAIFIGVAILLFDSMKESRQKEKLKAT